MVVHLSIFDLQIVLQAQRYQNIFTSSANIQNVFTSSYLVCVQHCCLSICTVSEMSRVSTLYVNVCRIAIFVYT